jgi:catechol 2,3-dioxygenase-like lactoylglutathione lyase family enzyme
MNKEILGLHHVTAIAGDPQRNIDFYAGLLGLRMVKLTVNFDDPSTYHLYYGDEMGHPGTILTFFPWPGAPKGRHGTGQLTATSFSIPEEAVGFWVQRLGQYHVAFEEPSRRFGEHVISFSDPDGLRLELVASHDARQPWRDGPVPAEYAVRGFHSVTLSEDGYDRTAPLLTNTLGFHQTLQEGNRSRYEIGEGGAGALVDILSLPDSGMGVVSVGTVHHVAWRTPDDDQQKAWRETIAQAGLHVTPVIDRKYFHSIYFREPGGVLFEVATDPPGFTVDEPSDQLGTQLLLPPWLEPMRGEIERTLPPVRLPAIAQAR